MLFRLLSLHITTSKQKCNQFNIISEFPVDQSNEDLEPASDYEEIEDVSNPPAPQQPTFTPQYTAVETKSQDQDTVSEDYDDAVIPANEDSEDYDDIIV